ncbi:MAG: hypothetical protein WA004_00685 [Saprospiraceae bacterium]
MNKLLSIALFFALAFTSACYYDVEEDLYPDTGCNTEGVTFAGTIQPILQSNCLSCHNAASQFGGVVLEGYDQVMIHVNSGALLGSIRREAAWSPMPQGQPKLADCTIEKIAVWIQNGAPNN